MPAPAPAPEEVVESPPAPAFKRRELLAASTLRNWLAAEGKEIDLETEKGTCEKLLEGVEQINRNDSPSLTKNPLILKVIAERADLKGLPVHQGADCQLGAKAAFEMTGLSRELRRSALRTSGSRFMSVGSYSEEVDSETAVWINDHDRQFEDMLRRGPAGVRTFVQVWQAEPHAVRSLLVRLLARLEEKRATEALARLAVFDLSSDVREAATAALKHRPSADYQNVFLGALRYPWPPAADHAAETPVALDGRQTIPQLKSLLDQPDPQAPTQDKDKKWVMAELVRVNHLGNCLLCHAPSSARMDPVRGIVPERGKPLPRAYYDSKAGTFVRTDVTYLKQDFSAMLPAKNVGPWPAVQRFDFLVRQRELTKEEIARLKPDQGKPAGLAPTYPQREAVLWALRELEAPEQKPGAR
jgi:hypothetical protein